MTKFNEEMVEKAKEAKSAEELLKIAKANNVDLTADEAEAYFTQMKGLSDDDLDAVAGGAGAAIGMTLDNFDVNIGLVGGNVCIKCGGAITVLPNGQRVCKNKACQSTVNVNAGLKLNIDAESV